MKTTHMLLVAALAIGTSSCFENGEPKTDLNQTIELERLVNKELLNGKWMISDLSYKKENDLLMGVLALAASDIGYIDFVSDSVCEVHNSTDSLLSSSNYFLSKDGKTLSINENGEIKDMTIAELNEKTLILIAEEADTITFTKS